MQFTAISPDYNHFLTCLSEINKRKTNCLTSISVLKRCNILKCLAWKDFVFFVIAQFTWLYCTTVKNYTWSKHLVSLRH